MSNELTLFQRKAPPSVSQDRWKRLNEDEANIAERQTVPSLLPGGRKWTVKMDGKETVIKRKVDGEMVEAQVLRVVVVHYNKDRSRAYYINSYDKDNPGKPDCWSNDGKTPDKSVENPPCANCANCPMATKGSKVDDRGKATTACQSQKFLAVVPFAGKLWEQPLRLKLAITSIYDGQSPDHQKEGWYAWDNYVDHLRQNGVMNTKLVITKMKFDPNTDYPKILFAADDYTDDAQIDFLTSLMAEKKEEIENLVTRTWTPNGGDGERTDAPPVEQKKPAASLPPPKEEVEEEADDAAGKAAAEAAAKKKKAAEEKKRKAAEAAEAARKAAEAAAAAAAASDDDDEIVLEDDDDGLVIDAKPTAKADKPVAQNKKETANAVPQDLADLVGEWANAD